MKKTIQGLEQYGVRSEVTVMIDCAPVTANFAREIGADIYTGDAVSAAEEARKVVLCKKELPNLKDK